MAIADNKAYLVCSDSILRVVDLSKRNVPAGLGQLRLSESNSSMAQISLSGQYAYVSLARGLGYPFTGSQIVDVSDPTRLRHVGDSEFVPSLVHGSRAYEVQSHGIPIEEEGSPGAILIIDLSDPLHPKELGRHALQVKAAGEVSVPPFVTAWENIIAVVNLTWSHDSPQQIIRAEFVDCRIPSAPAVMGNIRRTVPSTGVSAFPVAAKLSAGLFHWVVENAPSITSGLAYYLESYDVSDYSAPKKLGTYSSSPGFSAVLADFGGSVVHVGTVGYSSGAGTYHILDISNPASPTRVGGASLTFAPSKVRASPNFALFSCRDIETGTNAVLDVFDYSTPSFPTRTYAAQTSGEVADPFAPPLTIEATLSGDLLSVWLYGPVGVTAEIQRSPDLQNWSDWKATEIIESPTHFRDLPSVNGFYRARLTP